MSVKRWAVVLLVMCLGVAAAEERPPYAPYPGGSPFPPGGEPDLTHIVEVFWTTVGGVETRITVRAEGRRPTQLECVRLDGGEKKTVAGTIAPDCDYDMRFTAEKDKRGTWHAEGRGTLTVRVFGFKREDFETPPVVSAEYLKDGKVIGRTSVEARPVPEKLKKDDDKAGGEDAGPHAVRRGRTIVLQPSGFSFTIPEKWLEWHADHRNNLHLSREELEAVKDGAGEWDTEYGQVVNASLPFSKCAAHVGSEGWGRKGVAWSDVQVRAYVVASAPKDVQETVAKEGAARAKKFSDRVTDVRSMEDGWHRATVSYVRWYGDYGGIAYVDAYARRFGDETAVLVFMYCEGGRSAPVADIVKSFARLPQK
jgi:hypothetical protein